MKKLNAIQSIMKTSVNNQITKAEPNLAYFYADESISIG